jgi:hypothetical protein
MKTEDRSNYTRGRKGRRGFALADCLWPPPPFLQLGLDIFIEHLLYERHWASGGPIKNERNIVSMPLRSLQLETLACPHLL